MRAAADVRDGRRWLLTVHGDGGGFGVGSAVDTKVEKPLDFGTTLHGPILGFRLLS